MPGTIGIVDAHRFALVDEMVVGVGVVEVLGDRGVGAGLDLALEVLQVVLRVFRLRVVLGVGRDLDEKVIAEFLPDERHQFVGVAKLAGSRQSGRQIAAQRHQMPDAVVLVLLQHVADALAGGGDARDVRRRRVPLGADVEHGAQRALARRAARAEGHREELGLELGELPRGRAQLLRAFRRVRREELEAERAAMFGLRLHRCKDEG